VQDLQDCDDRGASTSAFRLHSTVNLLDLRSPLTHRATLFLDLARSEALCSSPELSGAQATISCMWLHAAARDADSRIIVYSFSSHADRSLKAFMILFDSGEFVRQRTRRMENHAFRRSARKPNGTRPRFHKLQTKITFGPFLKRGCSSCTKALVVRRR
jgi:hypothetical protein